jgi:hypothetical protein
MAVVVWIAPASADPGRLGPSPVLPENVFEDNLTAADHAQLVGAAAKVRKSVFFVGHPAGSSGTAFLVSREKRLLATAAHVADIADDCGSLIAIPDGSKAVYRVSRIYYHPDLMRRLDEGLYVRSDRVSDGMVSMRGPDVALLELAPGGPELPEACVLASDDELRALGHSPVVDIGFPGANADAWPPGIRRISARFQFGRIRSTSAFPPHDRDDVPFEASRRVRYDGPDIGHGASGGPACITNGHVIAVHTHRLTSLAADSSSAGTRADCVRDMLARIAALGERPTAVPGRSVSPLPTAPDSPSAEHPSPPAVVPLGPVDPRLSALREAVAQIKKAEEFQRNRQYPQAVQLCNIVIRQCPNYGQAYEARALAYRFHSFTLGNNPKQERQFLEWARDDFHRAGKLDVELDYDRFSYLEARYDLATLQGITDAREVAALVNEINKELETLEDRSWYRSQYLGLRAQCRRSQNNLRGAREDTDEAIRLYPGFSGYWEQLADIYESLNQHGSASEAHRIAEELRASYLKD